LLNPKLNLSIATNYAIMPVDITAQPWK